MTRGDDRRDPLIALRIPPPLNERLRAAAASEGTSISEVVRDAIEQRLPPTSDARPHPADTVMSKPRPARRATRSVAMNAGMCEHRVRVGNYCRRCNTRI